MKNTEHLSELSLFKLRYELLAQDDIDYLKTFGRIAFKSLVTADTAVGIEYLDPVDRNDCPLSAVVQNNDALGHRLRTFSADGSESRQDSGASQCF